MSSRATPAAAAGPISSPRSDLTIDNGNHLLLSANEAALAFLRTIGSEDKLAGPKRGEICLRRSWRPASSWVLHPNEGRIPWWIFAKRPPRAGHKAARLSVDDAAAQARRETRAWTSHRLQGILYERAVAAALSCRAQHRAARGIGARLPARSCARRLARGGRACRPLIAAEGLGPAFIDPALAYLERQWRQASFPCTSFAASGSWRASEVERSISARTRSTLAPGDAVILAVPASVAPAPPSRSSTPGRRSAPSSTRISRSRRREGFPRVLGIVNGTAEWLFAYPERISVTISAADRFIETVARGAGAGDLAATWRSSPACERRHAAMAHRQGAPRHLRRAAGGECQAAVRRDALAQSLSRRRLDGDGASGHHRRRDSLRERRPRNLVLQSNAAASMAVAKGAVAVNLTASETRATATGTSGRLDAAIGSATRALLRVAARRRPFRLRARGRRHHPGRICADAPLSRRAGRRRARRRRSRAISAAFNPKTAAGRCFTPARPISARASRPISR